MLTMSIRENCSETARLHLDTQRMPCITGLAPAIVDISSRFSCERTRVEQFIKSIYLKSYGARIEINYPVLMSVCNSAGDILAAAGFRYAADAPLFLERYIDTPIEQALSELYKGPLERRDIVEIGNLASGGGGASVFLFAALSAYLDSQGVRYATITGTQLISERLRKLGLKPHTICDANINRLPQGEQEKWGSYYDACPRVLAGSVRDGVRRLEKALGAIYETTGDPLYSRLHFVSDV